MFWYPRYTKLHSINDTCGISGIVVLSKLIKHQMSDMEFIHTLLLHSYRIHSSVFQNLTKRQCIQLEYRLCYKTY